MAVYLIHFDTPYPRDDRASVRHYLGFVNTYSRSTTPYGRMMRRLDHHFHGRGSRLMAAVSARGIGWSVVRVIWHATRTDERAIKRSRNLSRYCPVCQGKRSRLRAPYWRRGVLTVDNSTTGEYR